MAFTHYSPEWFAGYDVLLQASFFLISLLVSFCAYRIHKETSQRFVKYFGLAFFSISISYLFQSIISFMALAGNICGRAYVICDSIGMLLHIIFFSIGLSILLFITFKEKNLKLLWLLLATSLASVLFSSNTLFMFYLMSTVFLSFITWHFMNNYLQLRKKTSLVVAVSFLFLLISHFHFIISVNHGLFYVLGHILEFFAYILILINLYMVYRR